MMKLKSFFSDLGLFYAAAIWGSTFFIVKDSLKEIDAVTLVAFRFLISAFVMLIILVLMGKKLFANFRQGAALGILVLLLFIPQTIGLNYTTASNSGFITGLFIIFLPFFSFVFYRVRPGLIKIISVAVALCGLWLLTGGLKHINIGDVLTLLAAVTYALHILLADKYIKGKADPYILSFQQFLVVGALSLVLAIFMKAPLNFRSTNSALIVIFLALFPGVSAFLIQLVAQRHTSPLKVGLIFTMEPVFAAIFAWTLGGEKFIAGQAIGGALIVLAMILSELPVMDYIKRKKHGKNKREA